MCLKKAAMLVSGGSFPCSLVLHVVYTYHVSLFDACAHIMSELTSLHALWSS